MKKLLLILSCLMLALPAFAQEEKKKEENPFKFSGAAYAYGATYRTTEKDVYMSFSAYRFRPFFSYKTENVEATVKLEIDQFFGKGTGEKYAQVGADTKEAVEVKAAYLAFNIPAVSGLSLKAGVDEYKTPGGLIIGTEAGYGLATFKAGDHTFSALYLKIQENGETENFADAQMYGLDMSLGFGDIKVRPAFYLLQGGTAVTGKPYGKSIAILPSLGISMKMDALSIDLNAAYGSGKDKTSATEVEYSGYALDFSPAYAVDKNIKVGAFLTLLSGDKADTADKKESFAAFQLKRDGHGRMFLLENMQTFSNVAADTFAEVRGKNQGYLLFGGFVSAKVEAFEVKLNLGYGSLAEKVSNTADQTDLGFEADLSLAYSVDKNAKIIADFAYLATGKAWGAEGLGSVAEEQDALYAALGLSLKF